MRIVVQRVRAASVEAGGDRRRDGARSPDFRRRREGDGEEDAAWLAEKVAHLRVFEDAGAG